MSRINVTKNMINYLEERVNCENAIKFADKHILKKNNKVNELIINKIPVAYEIVDYNDDIDGTENDDTDRGKIWLENMFNIFDFISETNYLGYEYFPYLYGVLNCHEGVNSRVYLYYELFDENLEYLISIMEHASEWYDIVFQMIMINYYLSNISKYVYDGSVKNHLYRKLAKPYYKKYEINGKELNINHKFLIVLKDFNHIKKITSNTDTIQDTTDTSNFDVDEIISDANEIHKNLTNIDFLIEYIKTNKIKIPPSNKIMKLLYDIVAHPKNSMVLIHQYYGEISQ